MLWPPLRLLELLFFFDLQLGLVVDFALATRVSAGAFNIRGVFHRFALNAAVISAGHHTRAIWMRTLLGSFGTHQTLLFSFTRSLRYSPERRAKEEQSTDASRA
jgi:hypothetical protein